MREAPAGPEGRTEGGAPPIARRDLFRRAASAAAVAALVGAGGSSASGVEAGSRVRRWAMVIDLRRCDGCAGLGVPPQCSQYCNWGRFVPEGQQWLEVFQRELVADGPVAGAGYLPAPCMHCQNAPCVNVCPVGATFHAPEGTVLIDQSRCIGCRLCMAACPYDRRFFNWGEPVQPAQVRETAYNVVTQTPALRGTVMKCDFCTDRAAAGGLPYCVEACPRGAYWFGDLETDVATNGEEVVALSKLLEENEAFRFKEELGTRPRVYYINGHGEEAPRATAHESAFLKDRLEWPWREIAEATA
ncbi:MAG: 4Fe-4S dicluster domain-containing protein [Chloroflexi bacterium]|nr:4Fe-4S dicluster domain-containing protein [Chloroflexota bacterium]